MTTLGSQEWFNNAIEGETQVPIAVREGVANPMALVVNYMVIRHFKHWMCISTYAGY